MSQTKLIIKIMALKYEVTTTNLLWLCAWLHYTVGIGRQFMQEFPAFTGKGAWFASNKPPFLLIHLTYWLFVTPSSV